MTGPKSAPARTRRAASVSVQAQSRLLWLLLPALLLTGVSFASTVLAFGLVLPWQAPVDLLLLICCGRMALTAVGPLLGLCPRNPAPCRPAPRENISARRIRIRTAILLPIFNEAPEGVADALRVMSESLDPADDVAFFVLSDTQDPARACLEARIFSRSTISRSGIRISYRRRAPNTGRKAGNIAQFCADHGADFEFAIILDADSLMTASGIRGLIDALREDPDAALIQSVSYPIGGTTLFARMQQFGARLSTPLSVAGQDLWQHRCGTYWGHNAIVRLQPFIEHATLPMLPGRPPLGGEILCHDTIEAALLLRAGWHVHLATNIAGSYETTPSNLIDYLGRERRWCQGNLQHLQLLLKPGFRLASRLHVGMGILYYLAMPLGLLVSLLLLLGGLLPQGHGLQGGTAGLAGFALDSSFWLTMFLLFAPRLAHVVRALLLTGPARDGFGGRIGLILSLLIEQVIGSLMAPIVSVSVTGFVIDTFRGKVVAWNTASRGDRAVSWIEATRRFWAHTVIGLTMLAFIWLVRPSLLPWSLPFLAGLVLAIPLGRCLSSVRLGVMARRLRLFLTTDELAPVLEQLALGGSKQPVEAAAGRRSWPDLAHR